MTQVDLTAPFAAGKRKPLPAGPNTSPDETGLDDGPLFVSPRKPRAKKPAEESTRISAARWKTRREKYGAHGHG